MNKVLLRKHLESYRQTIEHEDEKTREERAERASRVEYYQSWTADRLQTMSPEDFYEYISKLWAMLIWGNKQYVVDRLIEDNGLDTLRSELKLLVWSKDELPSRWDRFRKKIKGMGPATISEILGHTHPEECALWNRRAYVGLNYLGVEGLPRYDYQVDGKRYVELCETVREIAEAMEEAGLKDHNLLAADYFIWEELQVEKNLSEVTRKSSPIEMSQEVAKADAVTAEFIHDEVKQKLADIGQWLGFASKNEVKVADGSIVDTVWESTIGNLGRVIYVFEVQTKGSIDSLLLNLLKALNNAAVQGVVAVSDEAQIEKIRKHAAGVPGLKEKLRYWDYTDVLATHESLEGVNQSINALGLVPQGFVGTK